MLIRGLLWIPKHILSGRPCHANGLGASLPEMMQTRRTNNGWAQICSFGLRLIKSSFHRVSRCKTLAYAPLHKFAVSHFVTRSLRCIAGYLSGARQAVRLDGTFLFFTTQSWVSPFSNSQAFCCHQSIYRTLIKEFRGVNACRVPHLTNSRQSWAQKHTHTSKPN